MSAVLVLALAVALALAVVPRLLGGSALTVLSGSMEPRYSVGDVVVVVPAEADDIQVGDVVTFQPVSADPTLVTHRVVAKALGSESSARFVTRGDANGADDAPVVADQIMGRVAYHVPAVGQVALAVGEHARPLVLTVAGGLLTYAVVMIFAPSRRRTA